MAELPTREPAVPEHIEQDIAIGMYLRGLLTFPEGGVPLKSGRHSPYYFNTRNCLSFDRELEVTGKMDRQEQDALADLLADSWGATFAEGEDCDHVLGQAQAVTALAALAARRARMSYLWERVLLPEKDYGKHERIEGDAYPGQRVKLADNVIATAATKLEGIRLLESEGLECAGVNVVFDRQEGGVEEVAKHGVKVTSLTTISRVAGFLANNRLIGNKEIDALHQYHEGLRAKGFVSTFQMP